MSKSKKPQRYQQQPSKGQQLVKAAQYWEGVVPHPNDLKQYEEIQPGFADRLIRLTESEKEHRHHMENKIVNFSGISSILSTVIGLIAVIVVCYLCYYAFQKGYPGSAATIATGVLVSLAYVFVKRQKD